MPSLHYKRTESKKSRRARKKLKRQIQGALLLIAFIASVSICIYQNLFPSITDDENGDGDTKRRLKDSLDDDYYINSLDEFPPLLFSYQKIKDGWWILNFLGMFYCFLGIAIICDDYFVPAIELIVVKLEMSEDTAGATWMAAGGSAPELFTSFVGTFIAESDVGFGTIVGSAVFNVLFIIGACAIFTSGNLQLQWWPFARDMSYYLICLSVLALFFGGVSKNQMKWWESAILLCMYFLYVFIMTRNEKIKKWVYRRFVLSEDDKALLLDAENQNYGTEISMQEKKTPKSPPRDYGDDSVSKTSIPENEEQLQSSLQHSLNYAGHLVTTTDEKEKVANDSDGDDNDDEDDEDEGLDLTFPDTFGARLWYIVKMPLTYPIYFTMFDVSNEDYEDWWPWTFFGSLMWLGGLSYLMVWWCVVVGYAWNIPQEIMGLVFLAAGTSVPELFSCIIVAKKGQADMAVSASIGSNIFDVLVGLPLPWLMFALIKSEIADDLRIDVQAHGLFLSILVLMVMLSCLLVLILINKWVLTHCMGYSMIILYVVFVAQDLIRHYYLDIEF